ncbi:hypothetical protein M0R45_024985 [Rubus argutus]|uniref:FAR1 domain-containing protein n=1 Tax=Rubus argutus TaxID=59490 RepID=A0AAW1WSM6_RUBAR
MKRIPAAETGHEQFQVMQTPQGHDINNGATTRTGGGGRGRAVQQPPTDGKATQQPPIDETATQKNKERRKRAAESIACSDGDSKFTTDYTSNFTTNEKFKSREDLMEWARKVGRSNGFGIVTLRSDNGSKGNKFPRVTLGCERSGKYDTRPPRKEIQNKDRRRTGTKKCDCPFRLHGKQQPTADWESTLVNGMHNHPVEYSEVGHSFPGRLSSSRDKEDDVRPVENLNMLQKDNERHETTTSQCLRKGECGMPEMQPLLSKLSKYNYLEQMRTCPKTDTILDFFLAHATSLDLLRTFPLVLQVQCMLMSKGNNKGTVLQIYGLTSTNIPFLVGLVFLSSKKKDCSLEWAFKTLQGLMVGNGISMPGVIVVDDNHDITRSDCFLATTQEVVDLMEGIESVFVTSKLLLETSLITFMARRDCKDVFESQEDLESFFNKWDILLSSSTAVEFEKRLLQLYLDFSRYPMALEYVTKTWLEPYKEKLVQAWTNASLHFGIVEMDNMSTDFQYLVTDFICSSTPPVKKQILQLENSIEEIHAGLELQNTKIKDSFESCLTMVERHNEFKYHELKDLRGFVSIRALELVLQQSTSVIDGGVCGCAIQRTHGLPCAHEIAEYKRDYKSIPLECIHPHWRKLGTDPLRVTVESSGVNERIKRRRRLSKKMTHSAPHSAPSGPLILHPIQGKKIKDKIYRLPLKFLGVCPAVMRSYILYIEDVSSDDHCSFRVVSSLLGNSNEDGWNRVRSDLMKELEFNSAQYTQLFRSEERVDKLYHALTYSDSGTTFLDPEEHSMIMPDMGHIIASCYNVVVMLFSSTQCLTFFPLRTLPLLISPPKEIVIGCIDKHFVQVFLKQGHPMPLIAQDWKQYNEHRESFIQEWTTPYNARIKDFMDLQPDIYIYSDIEVQ